MKNTKKFLSMLLVVLMCVTVVPFSGFDFGTVANALDASGKIGDNVSYAFDSSTGTLTITGTGDMYDYAAYSYMGTLSPFNQNNDIKSVTISDGVSSVGNGMFMSCANIKSVSLPSTIKTIGEYAFTYCQKLNNVTIPSSCETIKAAAFMGTSSLSNLTILNGLKTIGDNAFCECGFTSVTLPASFESMDLAPFYGCSKLQSFDVDENNKAYASIDGVLFNKDKTELIVYPCSKADESYTVPSSVKTIAEKAFAENKIIKSIVVGDNVEAINSSAFLECSNLESVTLSNKIKNIPFGGFYRCVALKSIVIPEGVNTIGKAAFYSCTSLESVTIPSTVTKISDNAFGEYSESINGYITLQSIKNVYYGGCVGQKAKLEAAVASGKNNESILKANIVYAAHDFNDIVEVRGVSCTVDGVKLTYKQCKKCGKYFDANAGNMDTNGADNNSAYIIPATGHSFTGTIKMDTAGKDGTHSFLCTNGCGAYGNTAAHTYSTINVVDPTCTEQGYTEYECECGDSYKADYTEPAGHSYVGGACESCGEAQAKECTCMCHKDTITAFIYMLLDVILTLCGSDFDCRCGESHF